MITTPQLRPPPPLAGNDGAPIQLDLNGSSFNDPAVTIIPVQLNAGVNTIQIGDSSGYAPDLDRIVRAPPIPQTTN
jgi:alpha-galactosidase